MMKFNEKYRSDDFLQFLQDFLPEDFVEKEKDIVLEKNKLKKITKAKELGFCESLDLYILEIDHNSETDPRMAIASEAFKILAQYWIHKALVIFKNKDCDNYRLSYLTISLDLNEKNKAVRKYSNARRYSFYLGPGAKTKTPELQLIKKGRIRDAVDLVSRFSLEVVNKQFYLEVAKYFDELVSDEAQNLALPSHVDANTRKSFAVRLIGRIMFCWFLKQKKSDSGQLVPDELLSSRVARDNYYHNMLERLFFEVLNTNIDDRGIRNEFYDKVPYLNGGLFSHQSEDYYELDRSIGASKYINTLKIKDEWFKDFFELLETYNFTIDENTVFDQELSVDPEMLGRIFENLLAEINPETGSSERKRTGSFYTPRQIVEYMVDQSLIEYLRTKTGTDAKKLSALVSYDEDDDLKHPLNENDKKNIVGAIESLRILDPACGSGAFPVGVLQKIVYILQTVDPDGMLWRNKKLESVPELYRKKIEEEFSSQTLDYIRKLEVIKNSIFGIDIQPIAVEVSRLRCFLTLVVESVIDDAKKNRGVQALPNLDFKFVCANTLIPAPDQEYEAIGDRLFRDPFQEKFTSAVDRYFSSTGANKINAGNEIHKLIDEKVQIKFKHLDNLVSYGGNKKMEEVRAKTNKKQIDYHSRALTLWGSYKNIFENKPVGFFETKYFFPSVKEGFDIVIGNPPYIKEHTNRNAFNGLRESEYYQGKMDLWYMFVCSLFDILKQKTGILTFIATNNWVTNAGASKLRNKIAKDSRIISLIDFGDYKIFESAEIQTMILIARKNYELDEYKFDYRKIIDNNHPLDVINKILSKSPTNSFQYLEPSFNRKYLANKTFVFASDINTVILDKISENANFFIDETSELMSGIDVLQDFVNKNALKKLSTNFNVGDGIFVLSNNEAEKLSPSIKEKELLRPYYTTKELNRYFGNKDNIYWIIYTNSSFKDHKKMEDYPNLKKHLDRFKEVITSENGIYGLNRPREEFFFKGEKIMSVRKCATPVFTYTDFDCYVSRAFFSIKTNRINQKYLTGLLNSNLIRFWLRHKGKMQGNNFQIDKDPIIDLPLIAPIKEIQEEIAGLIDNILISKNKDRNADIKNFESQIDQLIYKLYELTPEEIRIVENAN